MNKLLTALAWAVLFTMNSAAKVVLPDIISDNMVIQQNTKVRLWGRGNVNTTISVVASWNKKTFTTVSNDKGDWELWIETPCADYTLRQIEISDGEKLVIDNVLVGEVWLCSGQSNMEMPLKGFQNCPVEGGNESIATSELGKIKSDLLLFHGPKNLFHKKAVLVSGNALYLKMHSGLVLWDTTMHK